MRRRPVLLTYYVTEKCNASCRFCNIWKMKDPGEAETETVLRVLKEARLLFGRMFLDLTGGEPLLHPDIIQILTYAKKLGFRTSITTNTKLYSEFSLELAKKVDFLLFSLDGDKAYHDFNRGEGSYDSVISSIETAAELGERPDLIMTVTEKNVMLISHVAEIAKRNNLILQLNPVFSYFDDIRLGEKELNIMEDAAKSPGVYLNRAQTALIRAGGNKTNAPRCRGVTSNLVINTDGDIVLPCYHHAETSIPTTQGLKNAFNSKKRKKFENNQGMFGFCEGCSINCYFDPSYEYSFDRLTVLSLISRGKYAWERFVRRPVNIMLKQVWRS